jgi:hypothetical protein
VPKGLPQIVQDHLQKCRSCAVAAVEAYNRPGPRFRTAQYIVLITMAWTALFHAIFFKRRRRPWYSSRTGATGRGTRYLKVDGEPKHWELAECLKQYYGGNNPPERKNLDFLIGLRNKIEHRHLPDLDASLYGECQAALLNLEEMLTSEFGQRYALADQLAVSLQFSRSVPDERARATRLLASTAAKSAREYIERFRAGLPAATLSSSKYSFSVFLVPKVVNRASAADACVEFLRVDEASPEEIERLSRLNVLIKEKHIPIANLGLHKPSAVIAALQARLPHKVGMHVHTKVWQHFKVRPGSSSAKPELTDPAFCVYDPVHEDYVYTNAWIDKLEKELTDPVAFAKIVGHPPQPRAAAV